MQSRASHPAPASLDGRRGDIDQPSRRPQKEWKIIKEDSQVLGMTSIRPPAWINGSGILPFSIKRRSYALVDRKPPLFQRAILTVFAVAEVAPADNKDCLKVIP